ncbi:MAG TPA: flavin reductase family protein [Ktedonobacteraceae bacterium]|jgi:flavin reductase (DIM6/NTAB) family NADH-FMN oxidoreductase RutF|nr:flavin reductase family protein [Ktedonobacteraceae bacterium]
MDQNTKKQVLRMFTYGLYAVMCSDAGEVNAFTANWLSQASFEPPLLVVSVENASKSLPMIQHSRKFTVNVLQSGQRSLAGTLGKSALKHPEKLSEINYEMVANNTPVLKEALGWVACEVRQTIPSGDSTLVLAEIVDAGTLNEGQSLTMNEAGFRHAG